MQTHHSWEEALFLHKDGVDKVFKFFVSLWLGDLSWDNVELTKIGSFLPCSHPQNSIG